MGRGAAWPPNSFGEWMVGQNFKTVSRRPSGQTQILKVSLSEDEASGDETLQITYPGRRRGSRSAKQATPKSSSSRKRVSFDSDHKPLKSALKKQSTSPSDSSDTLVEDTSEDDATTEKDESSSIDESDTSEDEVLYKKKKPKPAKKPATALLCKKETDSEDSSAVKDAIPHETCECKDCVKGRKILKAMIKLDAKREKGEGSKKGDHEKQKGQQKGQKSSKKKAEPSSTEASETTETEATEEDKEPPSKQKKKKGEPKEPKEPKDDGKKSSPKENKKSSPKTAEPKSAADETAFKLPTYPKSMEPNLIMPIKSNVFQCEHTIEGPSDPRPNAFIDSGKGIVRIYHGPVWGNHTGELYGAVNPYKLSPLPPSARPHLGYHPILTGPQNYDHFPPYHPQGPYPPFAPGGPSPRPRPAGPPPGTPVGQHATAGKSPSGPAPAGMGLTGRPWPETPPMLREHRAREKAKERSEATNNVGPVWSSGDGKQGWGNDVNANGGNNAWGQTSGGDGKAKEIDFGFLHEKPPNLERSNNKSAKGSPNGGWGTGGWNNGNQQGGNPAGDNAWGDQPGNNNWNHSGGNAADGNQNWGAGSHHGSQGNANNAQNWGQQGSRRNSPQGGHADNGQNWNQQASNRNSPQGGNPDNGQVWGQQGLHRNSPQWGNANSGQGWNQQGSTHNSPQGGQPWGGPPGSRPASHHSRPPSNADPTAWATSPRNNTNNNDFPGNMPGSWEHNVGAQSRQHSGSHQPPQGWNQHGQGNSPRTGGYGSHGWGGPSAPQGPSFSGQGGDQGWGGGSNKGGSQAGNRNQGGGGPGGGWDENPSNNAGPTVNSWEANVAGDTKGASTNW